ncbi:unnamed protein product [Acanthosepion pharaonis]|uniref:Uncharacterized protein n=1 Tax=Acanthosepion pharaonis TaxID=158019 RepID=A0A812AXT4_ACAPH|nr:unnamed protein product [Sepia pharaonis]
MIHYLMPLLFSHPFSYDPLSHASSFFALFSSHPLPSFTTKISISHASGLLSLPVSSHPLPHPSNTTKMIHYLMPLLFFLPFPYLLILFSIISCLFSSSCIFSFSPSSLQLKMIHYLMPLLFSLPFPMIHYLMPLVFSHPFSCIFSCLSLPHPLQSTDDPLSHASAFLSPFSCIFSFSPHPSNTTKMIHYLMPLVFSHPFPVSSHPLPHPFQYN